MWNLLRERLRQGKRTMAYPRELPVLPDRFRGRPELDAVKCPEGCQDCVAVCPTDALTRNGSHPVQLDLGRCLFCTECVQACPAGAIQYTQDHRLAARTRQDLIVNGEVLRLAQALDGKARRLFGRSLKLRQISAGGCNACEADVNVLSTVVFDLGRFGIQFVASPRHADGLLITGPITRNKELAVRKTYDAVPAPKLVIAVGACAISGGPYAGHAEQDNGIDRLLPVDLYVPGCPPHPLTILDGLLRLLDRLPETRDTQGKH
jgi:Ni,Fe-hydrogenase III small subunit/Pyruvate/2-oxoacid:ferredoxin oxidoreductase delta subunit